MAQKRVPREERGWEFSKGGFSECAGLRESKCLREKPVPGTTTGTSPDFTAKAGAKYEDQSLVGPVLAETTAYKKKCPKESNQDCPVQLVFPPEVGPSLRLCPTPDAPGEIVPIRHIDEMLKVESTYCGCIKATAQNTKVKCARNPHG